MSESDKERRGAAEVDFYTSTYARFGESLYRDIRRETWDEDFGQNGWITAAEQDRVIGWLSLGPERRLLDVACGSGGPTLRLAERTRASVVGVDREADGIGAARREAVSRGLADVASFEVFDASEPLPFESESFDALVCIDAINHFSDRPRVLAEWARVLKPDGRLVFTDPLVVTGPLTNHEIAARTSIGLFLFVAPDTDERLLGDAGLDLLVKEDVTEAVDRAASQWHAARSRRAADLRRIEGDATFEGQQRFLEVAALVARERRLSRLVYVARKAG